MENQKFYQIVWNEKLVKEFFNVFCSDLEDDHVQLLMLSARKKYDENLSTSQEFFRRKIISYPQSERFLRDVLSYEVKFGVYVDNKENPINNKALTVYCTINPRSVIQGWFKTNKQVQDKLLESLKTKIIDKWNKNLESSLKSMIHQSRGVKRFFDIDIDDKDRKYIDIVIKEIKEIKVLDKVFKVIETRGGYHVLFKFDDLSKEQRAHLYKTLTNFKFKGENSLGKEIIKDKVEILTDSMLPIPGTLQGGFPVNMFDDFQFLK